MSNGQHDNQPVLTTLHGRLDLPELQPVFDAFPNVPVVGISASQRGPLPQARWVGTVPHGLPPGLLMPQPGPHDYFAFLGRIAPEMGPDCAIRIARACGLSLRMAAKVSDADRSYFEAVIQPMLAEGGVGAVHRPAHGGGLHGNLPGPGSPAGWAACPARECRRMSGAG